MLKGVSDMEKKFKEPPHGSADYAFEIYDMENKSTNILVTNHWHEDIEILYVTSGVLYVNKNNFEYTLNRGDILVINSGEMHEMYGENTDLRYYAFVFAMRNLNFMSDDAAQRELIAPLSSGRYCIDGYMPQNTRAEEIMADIVTLNTKKPYGYMLATKAHLLGFIALCAAEGRLMNGAARAEDETLKRIILYINTHFGERITLDTISREFNMSPKHFCRFFKNSFRRSFVEYVNAIRIEHAMRLLEENSLSVTETALSCGFSNMSYFARLFKRTVGCSPREYGKKAGH